MAAYVSVSVTYGQTKPAWCGTCLTSAAVETSLYGFTSGGGGPFELGTLVFCPDCDDPQRAAEQTVTSIEAELFRGVT